MPIHQQVDIDRWLNEFPLEKMLAKKKSLGEKHGYEVCDSWLPGGSVICTPRDLAEVEHTRRALIDRGFDFGRAVPTDVFLWSVCELSSGPITRIGGSPFRDPSKPWPTAKRKGLREKLGSKRPLPFLGQISFMDSKDLVPADLPGDVLCIYGDWYGQYRLDTESLVFEWVTVDQGEDTDHFYSPTLPQWSFCAEGVIHRTVSYPDCYDMLCDLDVSSPYTLNCFQATSIGQHAHFIQGEPDSMDTLVATFSSFQATDRWPFVNCPDIPRFTYPKGHKGKLDDLFSMMISDMGSLYFYRDTKDGYRLHEDSY